MSNILYTAYLLEDKGKEVLKPFLSTPIHENVFGHHCTIQFKPVEPLPEKLTTITIIGRLSTPKIDCLVVSKVNNLSVNKQPHITLSTDIGVKPFESNTELELYGFEKFAEPIEVPVRIVTIYPISNSNHYPNKK